MRLYAFLGSKLAEQQTDEHPYTEWIKTYSSKEFNALVNEIETLLADIPHLNGYRT